MSIGQIISNTYSKGNLLVEIIEKKTGKLLFYDTVYSKDSGFNKEICKYYKLKFIDITIYLYQKVDDTIIFWV